MLPIQSLFESHLNVASLQRAMAFYEDVLGLEPAQVFPERRVAFYWIGKSRDSMLGLWETGTSPQKLSLHVAFKVDLHDLLATPAQLRSANVETLDFDGRPTNEPVVLAWMPAASLYFLDPDGNLLELLAMLPQPPKPALGVVSWSEWQKHEQPASR